MAIQFVKDDNNESLSDPQGLRPDFSTAVAVTTGASIAEVSVAGLNIAANQSIQKEVLVKITAITNAAYYSFGPAASAPGTNATMDMVVPNFPITIKLKATDVSVYTQQITAAATVKIVAMT